ncbi:hypothetical protein DV515_00008889 [Chloebia gouldiae]|uniref:BMP/retinoic acid-inducible neural-specific protein 1 n=1 Tax=Chloebia gouldiae TaxID=44316 RepID=A0A3L8SDU8_CHLGU|nr:hypothetical protein DV515_00008889 [Chloebia gouldiae]
MSPLLPAAPINPMEIAEDQKCCQPNVGQLRIQGSQEPGRAIILRTGDNQDCAASGWDNWHQPPREFARWKVRNTAIERRDLLHNPLPLMPEFQRSIRLLGRRPTTQQFIDTIIKKYGTHLLISATLGVAGKMQMELGMYYAQRTLSNGSLWAKQELWDTKADRSWHIGSPRTWCLPSRATSSSALGLQLSLVPEEVAESDKHTGICPAWKRRLLRGWDMEQHLNAAIFTPGHSRNSSGEEALTMYMDKSRLDRKSGNATQSVEALHQLASSYFVDRDGTMRRLHEIQISTGAIKVTETRTGPLGCNSYDNLDSVSSVLLQSTESKLHLQGLQIIFPQYLQEKFVQSALSYIMCNGEGEYICRDSQCGCQCSEEFPQCNCPITDIQIMEYTLANMAKTWTEAYKDLENSGESGGVIRVCSVLMLVVGVLQP